MHLRAHSGSEILAHPNFKVPMLLAKFGPHRDALQYAFTHSCRPSLENNAVIAEWTYNVRVGALICASAIPEPWIAGHMQTNHVSFWVGGFCPRQPKDKVRL